ncbi:MAG: outer membrane beta-barrel protein [Thermoanaerobaculia bacterium]
MTRRITRATALAALLVLLCCSASAQTTRLQEFPFAVGAGGEFVTDNGRASDVNAFSNRGWHAFGEVVLESGVVLRLRYMNFSLPGTPVVPPFGVGAATSAPDVRVNAGLASLGYLFREPWWDVGLFGGVGVYGLNPKTPSGDQTSTDVKETVIGWHAGLMTAFHVAVHWDLRVEAAAYLLRTDANHKPITLGGSVAYHF